MSEIPHKYSHREWLNPESSASSGTVFAYSGEIQYSPSDKPELISFLEVSDCRNKIRLHKMPLDSHENFVRKIRILADVARSYADWLECNSMEDKE